MFAPKSTRLFVAAGCIVLQSMMAIPALSQPTSSKYTLVRLQPTSNAAGVTAKDFNNASNVVGSHQSSSGLTGYFYDHAAAAGQNYTLLGIRYRPYGINELNEIVGSDDQIQLGVYWSSPISAPVWLPPLPSDAVTRGHDINTAGVIVGVSRVSSTSALSVVAWRVSAKGQVMGPTLLPSPDGLDMTVVRGLSEEVDGITTVFGRSTTEPWSGVVWTLGIDASGNPVCLSAVELPLASDVQGGNDYGDVVGATAASSVKPFLKYAESNPDQLTSLPLISKATSGTAFDVNNSLQTVGENYYVSRGSTLNRAVVWKTPQTVSDLNSQTSLGKSESLTRAYEINDRGDILAVLAKSGSVIGPCLLISP